MNGWHEILNIFAIFFIFIFLSDNNGLIYRSRIVFFFFLSHISIYINTNNSLKFKDKIRDYIEIIFVLTYICYYGLGQFLNVNLLMGVNKILEVLFLV
jgi:hypothetical protein